MYYNRRSMYYQNYPYFSPFGYTSEEQEQQQQSYAHAALAAQAKLRAYRLSQQQQQQHQQQRLQLQIQQQLQQKVRIGDAGGAGVTEAADGVSFLRGTTTTTAASDFTPYGYVSRPGSTPLSYSLWGSSASTTTSEESYRRHFSRSLCRVVFGCAVLLVILAVLGIVGIAVYLGVMTSEDEAIKYEMRYSGELLVTRGDSWVPDLAVPESPAFRAKATKYEKMLRTVYGRSFLKDSLRSVKVTRFHRNALEGNRGLHLFFHLSLDRRKMPSHVDNTEAAVQDVLLQELMSLEPVAFQSVAVDIDSLRLARETETGEQAAGGGVSVPLPREDQVQVIQVGGTQRAPGGKIMVVKPVAEQEEETPTSTVANLIYQFGPWRPVNPFGPPLIARPPAPRPLSEPDRSPQQPPGVVLSPPGLSSLQYSSSYRERPFHSATTATRPPTTTTSPTTTTTTTTTTATTTPSTTTTSPTTTTSSTTSTSPTTTTTTTTTTATTAGAEVSTPPSRLSDREGVAAAGSLRTTTKRNLSQEDLHAYLAELLAITTPRPQPPSPSPPPQPLPPYPNPPVMVTIPPYVSSSEAPRRPEVPNPEDRLVTFQSILDDHQPPEVPLRDAAATTASPHAPDAHVTSYSGVREPVPPRPPIFRFPLDKFRFPARPPTLPPTTRPPPSIWDMLTTRKPLILNTELVTTTSTDVQFGLPGLAAGHTSAEESAVTRRPVYRPTSSSLAPVYRPTTEAPRLGPLHQSSGAPESLREFSEGSNYVTVPVISGSSVRYMVVNKTRPNYPNVVIVNLQTTPEDVEDAEGTEGTEDTTTTPRTPTRGESRQFKSRFLEDAFKAILQKTNYWGVDEPPEGDTFFKRRGRPVDMDAPDPSAPVLEDDALDSVSLWTFLRNLSDVYLSDPAVTQQLREFEEAALAAAQQEGEEASQAPLTSPSPEATSTSTGRPILRYLQNYGGHDSLIRPSATETNTTSPRSDYRYIPLRSGGLRQQQQQQPGLFTPYIGTPLRHRPVMVELPNMPPSPATPLRPSFPFHLPAAEPYTTLFVTGADSSSLPQIISISSRSPGSGGATTNSPIHTFVLKDGQTMEELLQEIFDTISLEEENETYSSTEPPSTTNTQTTASDALLQTTRDEILQSINRILYRHLYFMTTTTTTTTTMLPFTIPSSTTARSMEEPAEDTSQSPSEDDSVPVLFFITRAPDTSTTTTPATTPTSTSSTTHRPLPPRPSRPSVLGKPPYFHLGTPRPSYFTLRPTRPAPSPPTTTTETPTTSTTHNYDLELFPVMTRPMSPVRPPTTAVSPTTTTSLPPTKDSYEILDDGENEIKTTVVGAGMGPQVEERTETSVDVSYSVHSGTTEHFVKNQTRPTLCPNQSQFRCSGGECISEFSRCNLVQDCRDNSDEENCTCADFLRSKFLNRKICDGIVDCWDHSDETDCEWCQPGQFICSGSNQCIDQTKVCDGRPDCISGEDEKTCVTIAPDMHAADSLSYYNEGYLMVRKNGAWGKLCLENFERVTSRAAAHWTVSDLGQAVCRTLTFSDFSRVERQVDPTPVARPDPLLPPGYRKGIYRPDLSRNATAKPTYYKIHLTNSLAYPSRARSLATPEEGSAPGNDLTLSLEFEETRCPKRDVLQVSCQSLQCGMRPRAVSHRARYYRSGRPRHPRIVGGSNSGPGSWPWHAALYREGEYQCGGTLINPNWLLSAGHCFYSATDKYWVARLGALRRGTKFPSPYEQTRHITHIFIHPQYEDTVFVNDISLLRMESPVQFTDYVRPVCLPPPGAPVRHGRLCTLVGWGQLFEVGKIFPDTLQEVQVPLISTAECRKRTVFIPLYRITNSMFCAGYDRGGRDACLGDSGGPLMCQEPDGRWQLAGVTSNGYGCARPNRPGVYTKVASYLGWMNQVMELTKSELVVPVRPKCAGHRCPLGQCLPQSSVCNGFVECSDGSDEKDCYKAT